MRLHPRGEDDAAACARLRRAIPAPMPNHVCHQACLREFHSEPNLVRQGKVPPGAAEMPHLFVLACRTIHVCTELQCIYWADSQEHTCPISGMVYGAAQTSSYSKGDARTWYVRGTNEQQSAPPAPPPAQLLPLRIAKSVMTAEQIEDRCTVMVKLLLYSRQRVARNAAIQEEQRRSADLACSTYLQKQADERQPPFFTDLYRMRAYLLFAEAPLCILEFDASRCSYYVGIMTQIWYRVQRFFVRDQDKVHDSHAVEIVPRLDFESVILATLYGMRLGYSQRGTRIIPQDAFLAQHLPLISDLITHFSLPRDAITKGQKILRRAFENAFLDNVPVDQIELDTGALAAAVPPVYEERIEVDQRGRQFKIDKSGDRLFMLGQRRAKE